MKYFIALLFLSLTLKAHSDPVTVDEIVSVYDADTFRVNIHHYPDLLGKNISIRVRGVDAPEIRGKCPFEKNLAITARDFVRAKLANAKTITLSNMARGKYFRIIADVTIDGSDLRTLLLTNQLAIAYAGDTRINWCD